MEIGENEGLKKNINIREILKTEKTGMDTVYQDNKNRYEMEGRVTDG